MAALPRGSASRPREKWDRPWNATAPNGWRARCSGATRSRPVWTSSSCRAGKCSMHRSPSLKPTTLPPLPAAIAGPPLMQTAVRVPAAVVLALLRGYKLLISPLFTGCCRFYPSCADYTSEAVTTHGAVRGTWLGLCRLARCHPFGSHGFDPCPPKPLSQPPSHS